MGETMLWPSKPHPRLGLSQSPQSLGNLGATSVGSGEQSGVVSGAQPVDCSLQGSSPLPHIFAPTCYFLVLRLRAAVAGASMEGASGSFTISNVAAGSTCGCPLLPVGVEVICSISGC